LFFRLFIITSYEGEIVLSAERLQKVLASAGIASRRDCEELIAAGRVAVNGKVVHVLGTRVDLEHDEITLDGRPIGKINPRIYVMLHKPVGVVSTADDPQGRPTVVEMVDLPGRLFPIGRLDYDSEGLLLLTDDGELTQRLTHPSYEVEKEYRALLDQTPSPDALREWRTGVILDSAPTAPAWVDVEERDANGTWVRVVLHEGRKRQIRAVAGQLGYNVLRLIRVREGPLSLGDLPSGQWRQLTDEEVELLWQHVGGRDAPPPAEVAQPEHERERGAGQNARPRRRDTDRRPRADQRARDDRPPRNPADDRGERPSREERPPLRRDDRPYEARRDDRPPPRRDDRPQRRDDRPPARRDDRPPPRRDDRRGDFRPARRDDRPYEARRDDRPPPRRDDRPYEARRDDRPPPRREDRPYEARRDDRPPPRREDRPQRRDDRPPARRDDRPPPRRDDRRGDFRPARREDRPYEARRDDRPPPRREDRRGDFRPARREDRPPMRTDDRPQRDDFGNRHREGPEPGNERRPERDERQEKRGPSREWHARQAEEQRAQKQRGPAQRWKPRGASTRRTGVFRPRTSKEGEDES
jgi:23S rRNA pseudouridine2605 synthase